jgi:inosine/xanthosine triphosphatase
MIVVVASHNPAKLDAAKRAFAAVFRGCEIRVQAVRVSSGVKEQPDSDEETRRGAWNRVHTARETHPEADAWVGMEGGLERIDGQWLASAWMVVLAADGRAGQARTPTLPLPPGVTALIDAGEELGVANDRVFGTHNSKQAGGAFGLLTEGRLTRGGVYAQTLELALLPVVHDLWSGSS